MAMNVDHRLKFSALYARWCFHMNEKLSSGMRNPKQTNKYNLDRLYVILSGQMKKKYNIFLK